MVVSFRRHRPTSLTLFPYTTLFRSFVTVGRPLREHPLDDRIDLRGQRCDQRAGRRQRTVDDFLRQLRGGDRKSTRLNSRHSQTSYAVFRLKKKTSTSPVTRSTASSS